MEPFTIECTTCRAHLNVHNPEIVGQIVGCPKCGSMVLVEPPAGRNGSKPDAAEPAPTVAHAQQAAASPEVASAAPLPEEPPLSEPPLAEPPAAEPPKTAAQEPPIESPMPPPQSEAASPAPPPLDWAEANQPWRSWLMLVGGSLAGLLLAIGVFGYMISRPSGGDAVVVVPEDQHEPPAVDPQPEDPAPNTEPPAVDPADVPSPQPEVESNPPNANPNGGAETNPPEVEDPPPSAETNPPSDPPPMSEGPEGFEPREETNPPAGERDPLGLFSDLFGDPGFRLPETTEQPAEPETDVTAEVEAAIAASENIAAPRPQPRQIDIAARLTDPIAGIEFLGVPLADFVQALSDLSTIPVVIDTESLAQIKLTAEAPVNVQLRDTTVEESLRTALGPLGLELWIEADHLRIARPAPPAVAAPVRFAVSDLAADEAALNELAAWIQELVAPESWEEAGGTGTLTVEAGALVCRNHPAAVFQTLILCEKLRSARGLAPRSSFPAAWLALPTRTARAAPRLEAPLTLHFVQPTRWQTIFDRLREETGVRVLVDWPAVQEEGWNPDAEATFSSDNAPLAASLSAMVEKLGLGYRILDERTVMLSTPSAIEAQREIEILPLGAFAAGAGEAEGEDPLANLAGPLGEEAELVSLRFDSRSGAVLAAGPQPALQKLEAIIAAGREQIGTP